MFRVLIIDDTKSVHAFVRHLLAKVESVEVTSVFHGEEALELLKTKNDFDLILLDWEMPVMNGPATFSEFLDLGIKIPTLMMTTKNAVSDIETMINLGVAEYLLKPFTLDILLQKIEWVTGKSLHYAA